MHPARLQVGPEEDSRLMHATVHEEGGNSTCLSCYGANSSPDQCCNTCEEVCMPYQQHVHLHAGMVSSCCRSPPLLHSQHGTQP